MCIDLKLLAGAHAPGSGTVSGGTGVAEVLAELSKLDLTQVCVKGFLETSSELPAERTQLDLTKV